MSVGLITFDDIHLASKMNDPDYACAFITAKAGIGDSSLQDILVNQDAWINAPSNARRMQLLLTWLQLEFIFEHRSKEDEICK